MTNQQAAQILRDYVEWSQNGLCVPMPFKVKTFVKAIDTAVNALIKADKWDILDEKIGAFYVDDVSTEDDESGLVGIGEIAAVAFGYL